MHRFAALLLLALLTSCARVGNLGNGIGGVLAADARALPSDDPAAPGPHAVVATGLSINERPGAAARSSEHDAFEFEDGFPIVLYRPSDQQGPLPAVVLLPARSAPEWQYESYGRALASHGFVVATRGWYSFFRTDPELAQDARRIAHWLVAKGYAEEGHIGLAGHSMGGKSAIMAAIEEPGYAAVVAIDPDENGRAEVARGPIAHLTAPLLVIGMEVAYKAFRLCATPNGNFRSFFPRAPKGTTELTLLGADHVQPMDKPDELGMGICRVGTANSTRVRTVTRAAVVSFFERHLLGRTVALPAGPGIAMRQKGLSGQATRLTSATTR